MFLSARFAVASAICSLLSFQAAPAPARVVANDLTILEKVLDLNGRTAHALSIDGTGAGRP